jgi:hypothetical protein
MKKALQATTSNTGMIHPCCSKCGEKFIGYVGGYYGDPTVCPACTGNMNKGSWGHSSQQCLHDSCTECRGTGIKITGGACVHAISCPCPKCSLFC